MPNVRHLLVRTLVLLVLPIASFAFGLRGASGPRENDAAAESRLGEAVRRGELPSWDPERSTGVALAALSSPGAWDPVRAPRYLAPPGRAGACSDLLALILAGFGAWSLLARRATSARSCCFAAWTVQGGAWLVLRMHGPAALDAAAWMPWACWAVDGVRRGARGSAFALVLATAFAFVAGDLVAGAIVAAGALLYAAVGARFELSVAMRALLACALGFAAAAVQWWPALAARDNVVFAVTKTSAEEPSAALLDALRHAAGDGRVLQLCEGTEAQLALAAHGIAELAPARGPADRRAVELLRRADPAGASEDGGWRLAHASFVNHRVLDLLRVSAIVTRSPIENPRLTLVHFGDGAFVYGRAGALPLVRVVPAELVRVGGDVAVLGLLAAGGLDPSKTAVASTEDALPESASRAPFVPGELLVRRSASDRIDVEVRGSSGGWLVFQERFSDGWKAAIDGADAEFVRVDHACRALCLKPGDSIVRTKYEPLALRLGAALSIAALLVAFALAAREERARSR
ncbi:MAG: hypothetical protein HZA53_10015 [Planctomycetes bacterium]|nr:hypothetical protein [Planctomycetota bacterium]